MGVMQVIGVISLGGSQWEGGEEEKKRRGLEESRGNSFRSPSGPKA
jgi:hypothetical protein